MRPDKRPQGFRDSEGDEEVWPGKLFFQLVVQPLLGFMMLALRTVPVAAGMIDMVLTATALALIEAVSVMSGSAVLDGV